MIICASYNIFKIIHICKYTVDIYDTSSKQDVAVQGIESHLAN